MRKTTTVETRAISEHWASVSRNSLGRRLDRETPARANSSAPTRINTSRTSSPASHSMQLPPEAQPVSRSGRPRLRREQNARQEETAIQKGPKRTRKREGAKDANRRENEGTESSRRHVSTERTAGKMHSELPGRRDLRPCGSETHTLLSRTLREICGIFFKAKPV